MQAGGDDRRMEVRRLRTPAEFRALSDSGEDDPAEESRKITGDSSVGENLNLNMFYSITFLDSRSRLLIDCILILNVFNAGGRG